jgi:hypothetical protein
MKKKTDKVKVWLRDYINNNLEIHQKIIPKYGAVFHTGQIIISETEIYSSDICDTWLVKIEDVGGERVKYIVPDIRIPSEYWDRKKLKYDINWRESLINLT